MRRDSQGTVGGFLRLLTEAEEQNQRRVKLVMVSVLHSKEQQDACIYLGSNFCL